MSGVPPKYLVMPGPVRSQKDGDIHYIGASKLMFLYGVEPWQCCTLPTGTTPWDERRRDELLKRKDLIPLMPRTDGNYALKRSE